VIAPVNPEQLDSVESAKDTTMNTIASIWPEDERDRKRAPLRG
jgi:hypothetical protein